MLLHGAKGGLFAPAARDAADDFDELLEHLPLPCELPIHVVVEKYLGETVGGVEPPHELVEHQHAPQRRDLGEGITRGKGREERGGGLFTYLLKCISWYLFLVLIQSFAGY